MSNGITNFHAMDLLLTKQKIAQEKIASSSQDSTLLAKWTKIEERIQSLLKDVPFFFFAATDNNIWVHRDNLENYANSLGEENYKRICEAAENYFRIDELRDDELDLFFTDFLIANLYRYHREKLKNEDLIRVYPKYMRAADEWDGDKHSVLAFYFLKKAIKYGAIFLLIAFLYSNSTDKDQLPAIIATIICILIPSRWVWKFIKFFRYSEKSRRELDKIIKMYDLTRDGMVRWNSLAVDINSLRNSQIKLPIALYTALEKRLTIAAQV